MKASELIAELQRGIDEGRDWEVVCSTTHTTLHKVIWHMPSRDDRDDGCQPFITVEQNWLK